MPKEFKSFDHGFAQVNLTHHGEMVLMRPTEIHIKQDGTTGNKPSFSIAMENLNNKAVGEISLRMLNEALNEIGYSITKNK